jgi:hypothetical protein
MVTTIETALQPRQSPLATQLVRYEGRSACPCSVVHRGPVHFKQMMPLPLSVSDTDTVTGSESGSCAASGFDRRTDTVPRAGAFTSRTVTRLGQVLTSKYMVTWRVTRNPVPQVIHWHRMLLTYLGTY